MGQIHSALNSLQEMSAEDVAGIVEGMGVDYQQYASNIMSNRIDGMMISQTEESALPALFDKIGVTVQLHQENLKLCFSNIGITRQSIEPISVFVSSVERTRCLHEVSSPDGLTAVKGELTIHHHGGQYTGDVIDGKANGFGICSWSMGLRKGHKHEGEFRCDERNGHGKLVTAEGDVYEGEWRNDEKNGRGKMSYIDDGAIYDGDWKDGVFHGRGVMTYPDGNVYDGEWRNDKMNGRGKFTYPDGRVYDGDYKDDKRNGRCKFTYPDGTVYDGDEEV